MCKTNREPNVEVVESHLIVILQHTQHKCMNVSCVGEEQKSGAANDIRVKDNLKSYRIVH